MKQDRTESFESPLDEVLENIPQEDPPEDLERRCLDALGGAAGERPSHPTWWLPVRNVIAVAAGLVLVVGAIHVIGPGVSGGMERVQYESAEAPPADRGPSREYMLADEPMSEMAPPTMGEAPAPRVGGDQLSPEMEDAAVVHGYAEEAREVRASRYDSEIAPRGDAADIVSRPRPPVDAERPRAPEVEDPWRDFSGRRQVVTTKELDVEVGDVEGAYDDARSIVSKHGGFIASDRLQIAEDRPDEAHLTIRVPVGSFESAITDLRQLGEVTRLVGESVDVTEQYYGEGAEIREKADREQWLMDRLENADSERERQQLQHQINQLRREMEQEKEILSSLAEQTHWPVLELTLTEASSPGEFLSRTLGGSLNVLAWVGATAIIWVPLVVLLTLFWRRLTPRVSE
ncbi:MAG: DUF4349 domain-containing protein [Armatimonadota bacterium]|jgi:hypothetical protein